MTRLLPSGTVPVGGGLAVLGIAAYLHLAVAGHLLTPAAFSSLAVLWAIVFTLDLGLFMPVEQEISRHVATLRVRGVSPGPVLARAGVVTATTVAVLTSVTLAAAAPLADRLFGGNMDLPWAICAALAGLALAHTSRGTLAGLGRFRCYGAQLGLDGGLRICLVVAFAMSGVTSVLWYALILAVAPVGAVLLTLPGCRTGTAAGSAAAVAGPGNGLGWRDTASARIGWRGAAAAQAGWRGAASARIGWRTLLGGLGLLSVSSLIAQFVANVGVINARLIAPTEVVIAGALLSALVLVRIPLFVFASLQAPLLPGLAAALASGDGSRFRALLHRALAIVSGLGLGYGVPVVLLGPGLVGILFGTPDVLTAADFGWLAAGTVGYLWAMVLGQGLLAQQRHLGQAAAWSAGAAALTTVTLLPLPVALRVEVGYTAGSIVTAAGMAIMLRPGAPAPRRRPSDPATVTAAGAGPG